MANQKEAKVLRERVMEAVEAAGVEGMEVLGRTSEGVLLQVGEDFVVVRAIVKAETFEAEAAMAEFAEKQAKAEAKEKEKAEKAAKREKEGA